MGFDSSDTIFESRIVFTLKMLCLQFATLDPTERTQLLYRWNYKLDQYLRDLDRVKMC